MKSWPKDHGKLSQSYHSFFIPLAPNFRSYMSLQPSSVLSHIIATFVIILFFLITDAFTQSSNQVIFFLQIGRHSNLKLSMSGCKIIMALPISFQ